MLRQAVLAFSLALSFGSIMLPFAANAQAAKVYRIGVLPARATFRDDFRDAMRKLGWVEGQNFKIEQRYTDKEGQLPALAADLVQLKVDLIVTQGTPATQAAKRATGTIPIVFQLAADPVESGLVASFARPGGNLTGFAFGIYTEKQLEVLKEALPAVSRVAVPMFQHVEPSLLLAARGLGVQVQGIAVQFDAVDWELFFAAARRVGATAVLIPNFTLFSHDLERIAAVAAKSRLPTIGYSRKLAESGCLLSYAPKDVEGLARVAVQVDKILKGAKPADLPVEQPTKFELVINLKTAKALGLTIPQSLLLGADELIQ